MRLFLSISSVASLLLLSSVSTAAIQISVGNTSIAEGGTGFINVTATGDGDLVDIMNAEFRITPSGSTRLEFIDPPIDDQLTDGNYIFAGDSAGGTGFIDTVNDTNDTYFGGDGTMSGNGVSVTSSVLLFRLWFTTITGNDPSAGDSFSVTLESLGFTGFTDPNFDPIDYSSTPGTITITEVPSTVPEPATLFTFAGLGLGLAVARMRQCKRAMNEAAAA